MAVHSILQSLQRYYLNDLRGDTLLLTPPWDSQTFLRPWMYKSKQIFDCNFQQSFLCIDEIPRKNYRQITTFLSFLSFQSICEKSFQSISFNTKIHKNTPVRRYLFSWRQFGFIFHFGSREVKFIYSEKATKFCEIFP